MTLPAEVAYRVADGVLHEWLFDEMVILDTRNGWKGTVNLTAGVILEMFASPTAAQEAIDELVTDIGLDTETATTSVRSMIESLVEQGVLEVSQ